MFYTSTDAAVHRG